MTVLLHPYMPVTTEKLRAALGEGSGEAWALERAQFGAGTGGTTVQKLAPLFPRIEAGEPA